LCWFISASRKKTFGSTALEVASGIGGESKDEQRTTPLNQGYKKGKEAKQKEVYTMGMRERGT